MKTMTHDRGDPATDSVLLRATAEGGTTLTLHRPAQYNALSSALIDALHQAVADLARDETTRVVVIAGAGKAFCTGHDIKQLRADRRPDFVREVFARFSEVMVALTRLPQPVIARVHGVAA